MVLFVLILQIVGSLKMMRVLNEYREQIGKVSLHRNGTKVTFGKLSLAMN